MFYRRLVMRFVGVFLFYGCIFFEVVVNLGLGRFSNAIPGDGRAFSSILNDD